MTVARALRNTTICLLLVCLLASTAGCGQDNNKNSNPQTMQDQNPNLDLGPQETKSLEMLTADSNIPLVHHHSTPYISLDELTKTAGFYTEWNAETKEYKIGQHDVQMTVQIGSMLAMKEDEQIELPLSPILIDDVPYLPVVSLPVLFDDEISYRLSTERLFLLTPTDNISGTEEDLEFQDDPADPFKEDEAVWSPFLTEPVLKNVNMNQLIRTGRRYMGVRYRFGAAVYSRSKRFDCSSFTKFVYGKYGVYLKRTSRAQARQGISVSRKSLRKGDLMFFYVPGRFKSNKIVGHVGIYIGNGQMLHSSPEPKNGVQITSINKAFWKKTFIKARRVAY